MKIESHLVMLLRIGSWVPARVGEREVEGSVGPLQTVHRSCKRSHFRQRCYTHWCNDKETGRVYETITKAYNSTIYTSYYRIPWGRKLSNSAMRDLLISCLLAMQRLFAFVNQIYWDWNLLPPPKQTYVNLSKFPTQWRHAADFKKKLFRFFLAFFLFAAHSWVHKKFTTCDKHIWIQMRNQSGEQASKFHSMVRQNR